MGRLIVAIALAVFLGQVLAAPVLAGVDICEATCPDDGTDGTCAPACADCGCCSHASRSLIPPPGTARPAAHGSPRALAGTDLHPPAAHPQDVFHVPRLALA